MEKCRLKWKHDVQKVTIIRDSPTFLHFLSNVVIYNQHIFSLYTIIKKSSKKKIIQLKNLFPLL